MHYPKIPPRKSFSVTVSRFGGLNRESRPGVGELARMENMSSGHYPLLSPRQGRSVYRRPASPQGLIAREKLCYVDGADFVVGDTRVAMGLSVEPRHCPKRLIGMGAYVLIWPDKMYINTENPEDFGPMEASNTVTGAEFHLCLGEEGVTPGHSGPDAPVSPENGTLWLDTSGEPALRRYSAAQGSWATVPDTRVKITAPGIGRGFSPGDTVELSGCEKPERNGFFVLAGAEADALMLEGCLEAAFVQEGAIKVTREVPEMDHVTEWGNRLWGCRYGLNRQGVRVNEIYASKLGDFKNWKSFRGLSTDSFAAACGTPGPFTGAAAFGSGPLFFKEEHLHRVYGTEPATFGIQAQPCRGVQPGCAGTLRQVGDRLFYMSRFGVCAYDGAAPEPVSRKLGSVTCTDAVAGAVGERYYLSLRKADGTGELLVYDSRRDLWHREDGLGVSAFCALEGKLYAIDSRSRDILCLSGGEEDFSWMARTGPLGLDSPERTLLSRLDIRLTLDPGARVEIYAHYDGSPDGQLLGVVYSRELRNIRLPLRPRRCDHLALEFRGRGGAKIMSVTGIYERGSDQP